MSSSAVNRARRSARDIARGRAQAIAELAEAEATARDAGGGDDADGQGARPADAAAAPVLTVEPRRGRSADLGSGNRAVWQTGGVRAATGGGEGASAHAGL